MISTFRTFLFAAILSIGFSAAFSTSASADCEWTFLVFLNGNNNLDMAGHEDIKEMVEGMKNAKDGRVCVLVQWASLENKKVQRVQISNKGMEVLEDLGKVDMGDIKSLEAFVKWGTEKSPGKRTFLDVWNHGSGWKFKAISHDELTNNMITTEQITDFLTRLKTYTGTSEVMLGFDACLMGACDLTSEWSPYVRYMLASAEVEPAEGWDYRFLTKVNETEGEILPENVGKTMIKAYNDFYEPKNRAGTLALIDMSKTGEFEVATKKFTDTVSKLISEKHPDMKVVLEGIFNSLRYSDDEYMDLGDFLGKILSHKDTTSPELKASATELQTKLKGMLIDFAHTSAIPNATGLSIWLPTSLPAFLQEKGRYEALQIAKNTGWAVFIEAMLDFQNANKQLLCDIILKTKTKNPPLRFSQPGFATYPNGPKNNFTLPVPKGARGAPTRSGRSSRSRR